MRLSSKSLFRSGVVAVLRWCRLSLFLHAKCAPTETGVTQYSLRLEHGLEVQGLVVPFQTGSRDPYIHERTSCCLARVQRQERDCHWSSASNREFTHTTRYGFILLCLTKHTNDFLFICYEE